MNLCLNKIDLYKGFPGRSGVEGYQDHQHSGGANGQADFAFLLPESNWVPIVGYGRLNIPGKRDGVNIEYDNFANKSPQLLYESAHNIIRRICWDCDEAFQDLYYRRYTSVADFDLWYSLLRDFKHEPGNQYDRDFNIFSTYEDAVKNINAWQYCEEEHDGVLRGFPGLCRPTEDDIFDGIDEQWGRAEAPDTKEGGIGMAWRDKDIDIKHIAFYIEKPLKPQTDEWMTEDDEMKKFLFPESVLDSDDEITCNPSAIEFDEEVATPGVFETGFKPYVVYGRNDTYAGWYDLQGCGVCVDWCGEC